jgi:hypothetical protein
MSRCFSIAFVACAVLSAPVARGQDFSPGILKYYPGKWLVKEEGGKELGTVEWKRVAGGKAVAGAGKLTPGGESYSMAGWDPKEKKWVHAWFEAEGTYGRIDVVKFEKDTYSGPICITDKTGKLVSGECRNRIVGPNHFEITEILDGKKIIMHFHRK